MEIAREIKVGVRELLDVFFKGDTASSSFITQRDLAEGMRVHTHVRKKKDSYQTEVPVKFQFEWQEFRLTVRGKIDGLVQEETGFIVEEIKTTHLEFSEVSREEHPRYEAQLRLYMYFLQVLHPDISVKGRLTFVHVSTCEEKSFPLEQEPEEGKRFFLKLAIPFLRHEKSEYDWLKVRNQSIEKLSFPFQELRPGQKEIMERTAATLLNNGELFIEASTGIGKTIAVLFPVLKHIGSSTKPVKVFFLTAKSMGKEVIRTTLGKLHENGLRLRTIFITAKEKICPFPDRECTEEECPFIAGYSERAENMAARIWQADLITEEIISSLSQEGRICPFELSLDASLSADLIICDYNYVFDPVVRLKRFFEMNKGFEYILLADEAHNLVPRGREMFSASLFKSRLAPLRREMKKGSPEIAGLLKELHGHFTNWDRELRQEGTDILHDMNPGFLAEWADNFLEQAEHFLKPENNRSAHPRLVDFYFELLHFFRVMELLDSNYRCFVRKTGREIEWKLFCMNPGPSLRKSLDTMEAAVFFSGTLSPFEYFRTLSGGKEDAGNLVLRSPFPPENRFCLHIPGISTKFREREKTLDKVSEHILHIVSHQRGNYLVYFPSYAYMNQCAGLLENKAPRNFNLIVQKSSMNNREKSRFLDDLS
ncbi:MAG TPA: PD-(D/E)XK nuclease family protein, partial [bacterium]|nr:PD-(D/E)XK nuclease family protein [bacterium]